MQKPRRTQSLQSWLGVTDVFHWDGDHASLPEVIQSDLDSFGIEKVLASDPAVQALADWLKLQHPLWHYTSPREQEAAAPGAELFISHNCGSCHLSRPKLERVDPALPAMRVPNLAAVSSRAPYFHDGCARTLTQVFDGSCAKDTSGGKGVHDLLQNGMTKGGIAQLVRYLNTM